MGGASPEQMVLDGISKQAEETIGSRRVSRAPSELLPQLLTPDFPALSSCLGFFHWTVTQDT